jgi:nitric oxide reductase large subunit
MNTINILPYTLFRIFGYSIVYFVLLRLIATATYKLFPKFENERMKKDSKNILLIESLIELGVISILIFMLRTVLINKIDDYDEYEKYLIFVLNPALFSGPSDLKKKLDYAFS